MWTLLVKLEKRLDGCYTRLLTRVKSLSWKKHPTLKQIYGNPASPLVRQRRTQFAGHSQRATNEIISSLILWKPHTDGRKGRKLTFPDVISRDTGIHLTIKRRLWKIRKSGKVLCNPLSRLRSKNDDDDDS